MTVGELFRILPEDDVVCIEQGSLEQGAEFTLYVQAKEIPIYLMDAHIDYIYPQIRDNNPMIIIILRS